MLKQLNAYSSTGFVIRISFDIVISNIGMLKFNSTLNEISLAISVTI